jgi:hypothetical protein
MGACRPLPKRSWGRPFLSSAWALANLFHGLLMLVQAFIVRNEIAHLWTDVPFLLAVSVILWIYHPTELYQKPRERNEHVPQTTT